MSGHHATVKDIMLKMYDLMNVGEYDRLDEVISEDAIIEWPQSRERLRGWRPMRNVMAEYPGGRIEPAVREVQFPESEEPRFILTPMFSVVRTDAMGDWGTSVVRTRYPDGSDWFIISMARAHAGRIVHMTQYFAPTFEAPEWRAEWVERMEPVT